MFDIYSMLGNYSERKVSRSNFDWGFVDTASVTDGDHPYETAVEHRDYNGGAMIIVEAYDTKEQAEEGHRKWVNVMTGDNLPSSLTDCANSNLGKFARAVGVEHVFQRCRVHDAGGRQPDRHHSR